MQLCHITCKDFKFSLNSCSHFKEDPTEAHRSVSDTAQLHPGWLCEAFTSPHDLFPPSLCLLLKILKARYSVLFAHYFWCVLCRDMCLLIYQTRTPARKRKVAAIWGTPLLWSVKCTFLVFLHMHFRGNTRMMGVGIRWVWVSWSSHN